MSHLDDIENDLTCPISLSLLEDPIIVTCCNKAFSRSSLLQHFQKNQKLCPLCNGNLTNFNPLLAPRSVLIASLVDSFTKAKEQGVLKSGESPRNTSIASSVKSYGEVKEPNILKFKRPPSPPKMGNRRNRRLTPPKLESGYYSKLKKPHKFYPLT
jgi:hypothetical protein